MVSRREDLELPHLYNSEMSRRPINPSNQPVIVGHGEEEEGGGGVVMGALKCTLHLSPEWRDLLL